MPDGKASVYWTKFQICLIDLSNVIEFSTRIGLLVRARKCGCPIVITSSVLSSVRLSVRLSVHTFFVLR